MFRKLSFTILLALVLLLAACGPPAPVEYTIEMAEFAFSPDTFELKVGQEVTINLVNNGALAHEFMVGQNAEKNSDGQFFDYGKDFFASVEPEVTKADHHHDEEMADDHHDDEMADDHHDDEMAEEHHDDEMADDHDHGMADHGFMVSLHANAPEEVTTIKFTVTEDMVGEWEIGCFLDGGSHYISGMVGTINVTP